MHDTNHVPNPIKTDTMARIESDSCADTTGAGKNITLLSYTGYECNFNGFQSDLKSMEKIPVATEITEYDDPL